MGCLPQFPLCLDVTDTYTCVIARMNCGIRSCRGPYIILHNDCPQLKKQTSIFEDCSYYLTTESVQYIYMFQENLIVNSYSQCGLQVQLSQSQVDQQQLLLLGKIAIFTYEGSNNKDPTSVHHAYDLQTASPHQNSEL